MILDTKPALAKHTGTTTIAITCKDGVVFGTDRRATEGYYVAHKHVKKVYKVVDHIAVTTAGVVADAQQLVDIMSAECNLYALSHGLSTKKPIPVSAAAQLFSNILFSYLLLQENNLLSPTLAAQLSARSNPSPDHHE